MMRQILLRSAFALGLAMVPSVALAQAPAVLPTQDKQALEVAIAASSRQPNNVLRDRYRHPLETLTFFGVRSDATVVEVWPGRGWYTEILAPYLKTRGNYIAAASPKGLSGVSALMTTSPQVYGTLRTAMLPATASDAKVEDGSADFVLTFRNVHNWLMGEQPIADEMFRQMFAMLKPGGVLGIEEHRLPETADAALEKTSGYVKVSTVRRLAEAAGFQFVASSEINANPKDSANWPGGVWTLPPTLKEKDKDRDKYLAIGESDRMTLKFMKPAN